MSTDLESLPIFVEIKAVSRVRDAVNAAVSFPYPSHIISSPGYGKTTALRYIAREQNGIYVSIGEQQKTPKGLYRAFLQAAGDHSEGYENEMYEAVLRRYRWRMNLSGSGKDIVIVDEFQTAEDRTKRDLLRIQEVCGFALILSGNSERIMSSGKRDPEALRQIEDRIGMRVHLPNVDDADCRLLAEAHGVHAEDALQAACLIGTRTNARHLVRVLQFAARAAGGSAPTRLVHIRNTLIALDGQKSAIKLLQ